jgi:hypothetical protein
MLPLSQPAALPAGDCLLALLAAGFQERGAEAPICTFFKAGSGTRLRIHAGAPAAEGAATRNQQWRSFSHAKNGAAFLLRARTQIVVGLRELLDLLLDFGRALSPACRFTLAGGQRGRASISSERRRSRLSSALAALMSAEQCSVGTCCGINRDLPSSSRPSPRASLVGA